MKNCNHAPWLASLLIMSRLCFSQESIEHSSVDLGRIEEGKHVSQVEFSQSGEKVAYCIDSGSSVKLLVNGACLKSGSRVGGVSFSPDRSENLAYWITEDDSVSVYYADVKVGAYEDVGRLIISMDGRHLGFVARRSSDNKWSAVIDGAPHSEGLLITPPLFSPDGRHWAFAVKGNDSWMVVSDNGKSDCFDAIGEIAYSSDSLHLAFEARFKGKKLLIIDDSALELRGLVENLQWNAKDHCFAYTEEQLDSCAVVLSGKEICNHREISRMKFSPDGARLVIQARDEGSSLWSLIESGHQTVQASNIAEFVVPDGDFPIAFVQVTPAGFSVVHVGDWSSIEYRSINNFGFSESSGLVTFGTLYGGVLTFHKVSRVRGESSPK